MSPLVTLPNNFVDGIDTAFGSEVRANDDTIVGVLNGNIDYQNVALVPDFPGSVISSTDGRRLTENRFENGVVSARVLASDAAAGSPLAAVGSANHIKDGIVLKKKLKTLFQPVSFGSASMLAGTSQTTSYNYNITNTFPVGAYLVLAASADPSPTFWIDIAPVSGNTWRVRFTIKNDSGSTMNFTGVPQATVVFLLD